MFGSSRYRVLAAAVIALWCAAPASAQPVLGASGIYTENFNSIGASGTAPPTGWQVFQIVGDSNTWTNSTGTNNTPAVGAIPNGTAVALGNVSSGLTANDSPTGNNSNGYNASGTSGAAADRAIATAPTGIAGNAIELQLVNGTGLTQTGLTLSYDIRRYQVGVHSTRTPPPGIPDGSEELPGYWLFFSLDNGANYTAVNALIPVGDVPSTQPIVPNTVGITSVSNARFSFGANWTAGSTLFLRWIDDNAFDPSPDQIIGIDNIRITPIPEPSSLLTLSLVGLLAGAKTVRRRFARTK